jgi:hypothetical protein
MKTARQTQRFDECPSRWRRFKEYVKNSSSFTDWCITAFTLALAVAATYQFIILGRQLDVMKREQRAWISVARQGAFTVATTVVPSTSLSITNTGKSPATHIVAHFFVEVVANGKCPHLESQTIFHNIMTEGIAIPNAPEVVTASRRKQKPGGKPDEGEGDPLTEAEVTSLNGGQSWIAVHGIIWYDDIFKTEHWVKFCFWKGFKPGGIFSSRNCTEYNSVDEK